MLIGLERVDFACLPDNRQFAQRKVKSGIRFAKERCPCPRLSFSLENFQAIISQVPDGRLLKKQNPMKPIFYKHATKSTVFFCVAAMALATSLDAKPLKVFILAGQSNMEGHAQTRTFPAIAKDPKTADIHKKMVGADGEAVVLDDVRIAYSYGNFPGEPVGTRSGKLTAGYGSQHHIGTGKIGPEFTFGIYMHELLGEPILLIKCAWGGKSLMLDFRPPSAGELTEPEKHKGEPGRFYDLVIDYVKEVLADPQAVHPAYDPKEGYELAGFVWFQGFNDYVGPYPLVNPAQGRRSVKDFSEYSRLLACFIRDVRKDLSAPELPFVIGVLGVHGDEPHDNTNAFRAAMAAPAEMQEFKGNVINVFTQKYWPAELDVIQRKANEVRKEFMVKERELKALEGTERKNAMSAFHKERDEAIRNALTEEERFLFENGISNQGFHYHGSAKFFAQTGKAFAEDLVNLKKP